jgi:hypothetical protein
MAVPPSTRGPCFYPNPSRSVESAWNTYVFRYSCSIGSCVLEGQRQESVALAMVRATEETTVAWLVRIYALGAGP